MPRKTKKKKVTEKDLERFGMKMAKKWGDKTKCKPNLATSCSGGAVYGLGFIGALVYYISTAPSFWEAVIGFLKSIVWPAILVYELFKFLGL